MLDSETKRRIDSARDILVGKVPDPKSQVEQITIALVYKFMDDMDKQSVEMGGKASFFKGKFAKYGWSNIFDPRLGGVEMLNLYGEAITNMSQNDNLPQLFRDIFKNAFLPYRDPETLKLFLKTINEFTYDHSEKLGDAFEYLLSVLGSQGDAGQFRTPRHIIDFMVRVVNPKKNETILDPACGTAGFLISAYKHILKSAQETGKPLNAQDKKKIYENFTGYDISPDMVRLSLVNLYLHGFVTPQIHEYDALTSEDRWSEYFNVILANPPFMSPKGGIQPHKRFKVQSNRSEVLFVDYMAEHLTANGRAAIIVPEGIIFQSAGAYKQLRKYLVEDDYLWAVVSLPAGVFNPYAGVKTSILFLDKALAKKTDEILFVKVEADGFDLGAQRRPIDKNDLPDTLNILKEYKETLKVSETFRVLTVSKSRLAENEDYNLSADRYREVTRVGKQTYPMVKLGDVIEYVRGVTYSKSDEVEENGIFVLRANNIDLENGVINLEDLKQIKPLPTLKDHQLLRKNDILICSASGSADHIGKVAISERDTPYYIGGFMGAIRTKPQIEPMYLYYQLRNNHFRKHIESASVGVNIKNLNSSTLANFQIPLPPLETQHQIVDEIAAYQRVIDGARQVVEGWKPEIEIDDEWERVELGTVCSFVRGPFGGSLKKEIFVKEGYLVYEQYHAINNDFDYGRYFIDKDKFKEMKRFEVFAGDVLVSCSGTMGKVAIVPSNNKKGIINQALLKLTPDNEKIETLFLKYLLEGDEIQDKYFRNQSGVAIQNVASVSTLKTMQIPLPPLEIQREIVVRIERERSIVQGNHELIRIYEEKVKKVIERVWEG